MKSPAASIKSPAASISSPRHHLSEQEATSNPTEFAYTIEDGKPAVIESDGVVLDKKGIPVAGAGQVRYQSGAVFEGVFNDGKKVTGRYQWPDGSEFNGKFLNNMMHGEGNFKWSNGQEYQGEWRQNQVHGKGVMHYPYGSKYEGQFVRGLKEGYGIQTAVEGMVYEGSWKGNKEHGEGVLRKKNG